MKGSDSPVQTAPNMTCKSLHAAKCPLRVTALLQIAVYLRIVWSFAGTTCSLRMSQTAQMLRKWLIYDPYEVSRILYAARVLETASRISLTLFPATAFWRKMCTICCGGGARTLELGAACHSKSKNLCTEVCPLECWANSDKIVCCRSVALTMLANERWPLGSDGQQ